VPTARDQYDMESEFDPDDFDVDVDAPEAEWVGTILRATFLKGGRISMTPWMPGLAEGGALGAHFRVRERAGVAIADLRLVHNSDDEREVIVEFMAAGREREAAEALLCTWAGATGHRRVWLPSGPVEVDPPATMATAAVRCPTCRARWTDSTPSFWHQVRCAGHFPLVCPACAHTLPQWTVVAGDTTHCRGD
jgi:hypothetical protein